MSIPTISKFVNATTYRNDCLEIIKIIRPQWITDKDKNGIQILSRTLSGGITNIIYVFYRESEENDGIVIKVYGTGTDRIIDRQAEKEILKLLHTHQCGPRLYGIFTNGFCNEFLPGTTLTVESCKFPHVYPLIANELARFHKSIPLPSGTTGSGMWRKMRQFLDIYNEIRVKHKTLKNRLQKYFKFTFEKAKQNVEDMERMLERERIPVAVCHNDLLLGNAVHNEPLNKMTFIDFEYTMPNYIAYDVANHFNEFAGLDNPDFSLCPNAEFKRAWINIYLSRYGAGAGFTHKDFERWVDLCIPASHLFWALWAAVQAYYSKIDFDYAAYVGLRYREYERCMEATRGNYRVHLEEHYSSTFELKIML